MKTITVNNVAVDIHDGPIGISVSGGADSAILLYILMKDYKGPLHIFTCSSEEKNRRSPYYALDIIGKCLDLTGFDQTFIRHHIHFVPTQTYTALIDPLAQAIDDYELSYMYTAVTAHPPLIDLDSFKSPTPLLERRHPDIVRPLYSRRFYMPMFNINKKVVAGMYEELGVLEDLFPLTRSCESFSLLDGHCGECWWCEERKWGFGKL